MNFSATIPVADLDAANLALEEAGFGPANFSVPIRSGSEGATHAGLHCWDYPAFREVIEALPNVIITDGTGQPNFADHCEAETLEWSDPANWHENPVMTGDERQHGGKTWTSLIDYNVWEPPVGWREVVAEGYPAWVQPTGAHDAYKIGDRVTFSGSDYESLINGNVWSPTAYPAGWKKL